MIEIYINSFPKALKKQITINIKGDKMAKEHHPLIDHKKNFGEKAADSITKWAGSWIFILLFFTFLSAWISINTIWFIFGKSWDNYPFILLNLLLSCLAAIQAPIILMSQNMQTKKDRLSAEYDYKVNKQAEKEIREIKGQLNRIEKKLK